MAELSYEPKATVSKARVALILLLSINLFNYIDRFVLAAVEEDISKEFFTDPKSPETLAKMGSLATAFLVTYMLAAPIFGWLADRMSRWVLIGLSVIIWSLATGVSGFASVFAALFIARIFVGIGEGGYGPAAPTIIADLFPVEKRGSVMAWFYMAIPVGSALGFIIGGIVAERLSWHWAFWIVTPPGLLLGVWALFMKDPPRGVTDHAEGASHRATLKDYLGLFKIKSYVLNTLAMTAMTFAIGGISFWMPRYLTTRGLDPASSKTIFGGIMVVCGIAATLLGGIAGDKLRHKYGGAYFLVSAGGIFLAVPLVLLMLYLPFPMAWVAGAGAIFFLFFNTGPSNTALANVTHPSVRASAFALNILFIHALGDAISPPLLGYVAGTSWGWNGAFGIVALMMTIAATLWVWAAKYLKADTEAAPHWVSEKT